MLPLRTEVEKIRQLMPYKLASYQLASFSAVMAETEKRLSALGDKNAAKLFSRMEKAARKSHVEFAEIISRKSGVK